MPKTTRHSKKRHGAHHKRDKSYVKVYAPYLPLIVSIIASMLLSFWQPVAGNTLAYATEMSVSGLLSSTNSQRAANGKAGLSLNSKLNSAAQAKANDMVARDYWSHTTPDGQEPWVFIDNAGYSYTKAGENLAYGFSTSSNTVSGWMNSPSHKANMLDSAFTEVGFGFANSPNFVGDGQETVVVAMYGQPQTLAATHQTPAPTPAPTTPQTAPTPVPAPAPVQEKPKPKPKKPTPKEVKEAAPINTDIPIDAVTAQPQHVARVQTMTRGQAPWALAAMTTLLGALVFIRLLHHSLKYRKFVQHHPRLMHALNGGENLVLHHPLFDSTILGLAILGYVLSRTVGYIL